MLTPGSDQARREAGESARVAYRPTSDPPRPAPNSARAMSMFDALAVWAAIEFRANKARVGDRRHRVLTAVLNQTVRYQRVEAPVSRSRMSHLSSLPETSVGALLKDLQALGFLVYKPGTGRTLGTVRIIIPEGWNEHEQSLVREEENRGVADSATPEVTHLATPEVAEPVTPEVPRSGTPEVMSAATPEVTGIATRTGRMNEKKVTRREGGEGGGAATFAPSPVPVVRPTHTSGSRSRVSADAAASAGFAEADPVVSAFLEAMEQAETPFPRRRVSALRKGILEALETYDAASVLLGLGWWIAEGFQSPKQISEMTFKAMGRGSRPVPGQTAAALIEEGQRRYAERMSKPDPTEQRRAASLRAIQEYVGGAG